METVETLHMNKGAGETSYAMNSFVQRKIISLTNQATKKAIVEILCSTKRWPIMKMGIADLGCSSGPNALRVISEIVEAINATSSMLNRPAPKELMLYMNDLFTNDFNNIFASLPSFHKKLSQQKGNNNHHDHNGSNCFVSAVPGTFYGRLFPTKSLHFVHSSSSLHWLSKAPGGLEDERGKGLNKGKLYISKSSPNCVLKAYSQQFKNDFSQFLESRSQEMVHGGRMVLSFMGRESMDPTSPNCCYQWELLAQALMTLVLEGLVEEEKVDSFNAPYYAPCFEELKMEIEKEGSFMVNSHEAYEIDWDDGIELQSDDTMISGERVAKTIRAVVESMLEYHFGSHIMDELFQRFAKFVEDHLSKTRTKYINLIISLVKRQ
ncbi:probable jasmonic acid carboxyl methyltransferase 2 [Medicago truncatula]|uniref:Salicylic acid carboxyl methyltransferase n=1 Tax=Medicago truncatula TaxID=3880 RepID=A0A072VED2_MEDTR|nr:probable jasmonic acid carboxyl methyltransferase 2 [Medicago truncatula]KEH40177.1 salicylic acid carboxyl methyltransferase [Medicago truncatula]